MTQNTCAQLYNPELQFKKSLLSAASCKDDVMIVMNEMTSDLHCPAFSINGWMERNKCRPITVGANLWLDTRSHTKVKDLARCG